MGDHPRPQGLISPSLSGQSRAGTKNGIPSGLENAVTLYGVHVRDMAVHFGVATVASGGGHFHCALEHASCMFHMASLRLERVNLPWSSLPADTLEWALNWTSMSQT